MRGRVQNDHCEWACNTTEPYCKIWYITRTVCIRRHRVSPHDGATHREKRCCCYASELFSDITNGTQRFFFLLYFTSYNFNKNNNQLVKQFTYISKYDYYLKLI